MGTFHTLLTKPVIPLSTPAGTHKDTQTTESKNKIKIWLKMYTHNEVQGKHRHKQGIKTGGFRTQTLWFYSTWKVVTCNQRNTFTNELVPKSTKALMIQMSENNIGTYHLILLTVLDSLLNNFEVSLIQHVEHMRGCAEHRALGFIHWLCVGRSRNKMYCYNTALNNQIKNAMCENILRL